MPLPVPYWPHFFPGPYQPNPYYPTPTPYGPSPYQPSPYAPPVVEPLPPPQAGYQWVLVNGAWVEQPIVAHAVEGETAAAIDKPTFLAWLAHFYSAAMPRVGDGPLALAHRGMQHHLLIGQLLDSMGGCPTALDGLKATIASVDPTKDVVGSINPANLAALLAFLQTLIPLLIQKPPA